MDCVPSLNSIASMLMSDLFEQDGFEFSDSVISPAIISFQNLVDCNKVVDNNTKEDRKRKGREGFKDHQVDEGEERKNKRMRHREVERQRRQEVSSLFKTLRTLLPFQYVKGKRSSSDHVLEAVNYIKDLHNRIKELGEKRDQMKKRSDLETRASGSAPSSTEETSSSSSSSSPRSCSCGDEDNHMSVVVMPCLGGVEVVISCCFRQRFCLSSALHVLAHEEDFNVIRCTSTTLPSRLLHNIFAQVDGGRNIDFAELREKIIMKMRR